MSHELEIKLENKYVLQFRLDESVFTVEVDKHGRPQFPESVVEKVPPYIRKMMERIVMTFDTAPAHRCGYVEVDHEAGCAEAKELGKCNCDPVSVSYKAKEPIQQLGINIGTECVQLQYGDAVYRLDLDQNGY